MASDQVHFLKFSTAPMPPDEAADKSVQAVGEYIDQLEGHGHTLALDSLTKLVLSKAEDRGQYFVRETPQHDG